MDGSKDPTGRGRQLTPGRLLYMALCAVFVAGLWSVVSPFVESFVWAVVIVTASWPAYQMLARALAPRQILPALLMTTIFGLMALVIVVPLSWELTRELQHLSSELQNVEPAGPIKMVRSIPLIGARVAGTIELMLADKQALGKLLTEHQGQVFAVFTTAARGVFETLLTIVAAIVSCYFLYRHGPLLAHQLALLVTRLGGDPIDHLLETVHLTVRGAAYGMVVTALVQGALAGIGYFVSGAPVPILLGLVTMVVSLIPFGPPFLYLPVAAYLLASGLPWYHGVGLALWGIFVVSMIDNILRPIFISQATQISIVLVFIGVIGGLMSFGLLGVFLGPALMAVAQRLWLDYARELPAT